MNKKIFLSYAILMSFFSPLIFAAEADMAFRVAAFFPSSEKFREIYGNVICDYQLEATIPLPVTCINGWANIDWIPATGHSHGFNDSTRANIVNLSMGVKIPFHICDFFFLLSWYWSNFRKNLD